MEVRHTYSPRVRNGMRSDFVVTISYSKLDEDIARSKDPIVKKQMRAIYNAIIRSMSVPFQDIDVGTGHLERKELPPTPNKTSRTQARFWYKFED